MWCRCGTHIGVGTGTCVGSTRECVGSVGAYAHTYTGTDRSRSTGDWTDKVLYSDSDFVPSLNVLLYPVTVLVLRPCVSRPKGLTDRGHKVHRVRSTGPRSHVRVRVRVFQCVRHVSLLTGTSFSIPCRCNGMGRSWVVSGPPIGTPSVWSRGV